MHLRVYNNVQKVASTSSGINPGSPACGGPGTNLSILLYIILHMNYPAFSLFGILPTISGYCGSYCRCTTNNSMDE